MSKGFEGIILPVIDTSREDFLSDEEKHGALEAARRGLLDRLAKSAIQETDIYLFLLESEDDDQFNFTDVLNNLEIVEAETREDMDELDNEIAARLVGFGITIDAIAHAQVSRMLGHPSGAHIVAAETALNHADVSDEAYDETKLLIDELTQDLG